MKQLVLIDKHEYTGTGFLTVLPAQFSINIEGCEGKHNVIINFLDEKADVLTRMELWLSEFATEVLDSFDDKDWSEFRKVLMEQVVDDLAYFAANTMLEGCEEYTYKEGIVDVNVFNKEWSDFSMRTINSILMKHYVPIDQSSQSKAQ